jgi:hypothetical protein
MGRILLNRGLSTCLINGVIILLGFYVHMLQAYAKN